MKTLIIGCNGQLGHDMVSVLQSEEHVVQGVDVPDIDITSQTSVNAIIKESNPDIIINCAAYTAVDDCENNEETAFAVNAKGIANIATAVNSIGTPVVHFSTDYVFDGLKNNPYIESDMTNPQTVYGKSKLEGERELSRITHKHFIFRIAWLYGTHGNNFVQTIRKVALQKLKNNEPLKVVNDQFGTPTYSKSVCRQILSVIATNHYGIYHCTNEGACTWFDFAKHITESFNIGIEILPCTTAEFPRPAPRPPYSVLENNNLKSSGLNNMPHWKDAFKEFIEEIKEIE